VAVGHFSPDGNVGIATVNQITHSVSVLLGNGDGTFQEAQNYDAGPSAYAMRAADLTGSGLDDLVVTNFVNDSVSVLLNNGDGTFREPVQYSTGRQSHPYFVAVGDLTGDGMMSLVVTNSYASGVSVLVGNGDGTFQDPVEYYTGRQPAFVTLGDFTGSGFQDIAVVNSGSNDVSVLLNNGDGTFQDAVSYYAGQSPTFVTAADLTGKGILDLVVVNYTAGTVSVLRGDGDGSFGDPEFYSTVDPYPMSVAVADVYGDGLLDLVVVNPVTNSISVFANQGDGTFAWSEDNYQLGWWPVDVAAGDFFGDGILDLVAVNQYSNDISVLFNDLRDSGPNGARAAHDQFSDVPLARQEPSLAAAQRAPRTAHRLSANVAEEIGLSPNDSTGKAPPTGSEAKSLASQAPLASGDLGASLNHQATTALPKVLSPRIIISPRVKRVPAFLEFGSSIDHFLDKAALLAKDSTLTA
jgi:hypothetical protein